ncbi:acetylornithine deacetylase [Sporolactobacillus sp. THM7-7]|nr:acetylornithine deacetylase [Sporolactobacillus sp. THM7-7]
MTTSMKAVQEEIEKRQDDLLELLAKLVHFRTESPPARNSAEAQNFVAQFLHRLHFKTDSWALYPGDTVLVGSKKGTAPDVCHSLIVNGHIDVATVGDTAEWKTPPFDLSAHDGFAYGRGTSDMKGALAGSLFALQMINEMKIPLQGNLLFQSAIGEESGEAGTRSMMEKGYRADFAIVNDTTDCQVQGQGGVITGWISVKSPDVFHDGVRSKLIHAGGGIKGASAIEKMIPIIQGLQELERYWAVTKSYPGFTPGIDTINPAVIEGGRHPAFIADECHLWITVHFYPNETDESVTKDIEEHILRVAEADPWLRDHPPAFKWGGRSMIEDRDEIFPSLKIDPKHPAVQLLTHEHECIFGEAAKITMSTSVNDSGWLGKAGIPTVAYGPGTMEEAHSANEKISVRQLVRFSQVMAAFMIQWCNSKK